MVNPVVKKKHTPTQKAYSTPKSSPLVKESPKKPSLVGKVSAYSGLAKVAAAKRKYLDDEAEEEEEDWEEVDEPERDDASGEEQEEDAYAQLESEEELLQLMPKSQLKKKPASTSKQPPKKKRVSEKSPGWFDFAKKAVERIPLFSELQL